MSDPLLDQPVSSIPTLLQSATVQDNLLLKLNMVDTILNAVDDDMAKRLNTERLKRYLHSSYLDDTEFMRRLKQYSTMMSHTELALELLGQDYLSHPEFSWDEEFEQVIGNLNKELNRIVGMLLKEYTKGESIEF